MNGDDFVHGHWNSSFISVLIDWLGAKVQGLWLCIHSVEEWIHLGRERERKMVITKRLKSACRGGGVVNQA